MRLPWKQFTITCKNADNRAIKSIKWQMHYLLHLSFYHMTHPFIKLFHKFPYKTRYVTLFTPFLRFFASDVTKRSIMTSRKALCFSAIFARNFLKTHSFFMKYWYFFVIKRFWNEFSFHTVFMKIVCFISPRQRLSDIKHTTHFINYVWNENSFQIPYIFFCLLLFLLSLCVQNFVWNISKIFFPVYYFSSNKSEWFLTCVNDASELLRFWSWSTEVWRPNHRVYGQSPPYLYCLPCSPGNVKRKLSTEVWRPNHRVCGQSPPCLYCSPCFPGNVKRKSSIIMYVGKFGGQITESVDSLLHVYTARHVLLVM